MKHARRLFWAILVVLLVFQSLAFAQELETLQDPDRLLPETHRQSVLSLLREYDARDGCHSHVLFRKRASDGNIFFDAMKVWREIENRYPQGGHRLFAFSSEPPADHFEGGTCSHISNRAQYDLSHDTLIPALSQGNYADALRAQIEGIEKDSRRWKNRRDLDQAMEWIAAGLIAGLLLAALFFDLRHYRKLSGRFRALMAEQEAMGRIALPAYWASEAHYRKFFKRPAEFERIGVLVLSHRRLSFVSEAYKGGGRHVMEIDPAQCRLTWKGRSYLKGWLFWFLVEADGRKHYFSAGVPISYVFRNIWYLIARRRSKAAFKTLRAYLEQPLGSTLGY